MGKQGHTRHPETFYSIKFNRMVSPYGLTEDFSSENDPPFPLRDSLVGWSELFSSLSQNPLA